MATLLQLTRSLEFQIDSARDQLKDQKPDFSVAYSPYVEGLTLRPFHPSLGEIYKLVCEELKKIDQLVDLSKKLPEFSARIKENGEVVPFSEEVEEARKQAIVQLNKTNPFFVKAEGINKVIDLSNRKLIFIKTLSKTFSASLLTLIISYYQDDGEKELEKLLN